VATVRWTAEAERWLEDIYGYIAADNPRAAAQTVDEIYQRAQSLADFPEMGERYRMSKRHVHILLFGHYRIAYLVKDDEHVDILGVFHGTLDIGKYQL